MRLNLVGLFVAVVLCSFGALGAEVSSGPSREASPKEFDRSLPAAPAEEAAESERLAKKLVNPVADLISVPFQSNWDFGIGPKEAMKYWCNIQPVVPFSISEHWNLITRTIVPVIYAESPADGIGDKAGLGDVLQSFFLSPKDPVAGWILGAGPAMLYPTATDDALGYEKWGAGPTAVVLRQSGPWTYGILANHVWSYAGTRARDDVSATYLQPFLAYTLKTATTFAVNSETTYSWPQEQWIVPINATISQVVRIGKLPVQFQFGGRYYFENVHGGADWGLRFAVTFMLPKRK